MYSSFLFSLLPFRCPLGLKPFSGLSGPGRCPGAAPMGRTAGRHSRGAAAPAGAAGPARPRAQPRGHGGIRRRSAAQAEGIAERRADFVRPQLDEAKEEVAELEEYCAALTVTTTSGALVPQATTVRPMINGEIPIRRDADTAPRIRKSAPKLKPTRPAINRSDGNRRSKRDTFRCYSSTTICRLHLY